MTLESSMRNRKGIQGICYASLVLMVNGMRSIPFLDIKLGAIGSLNEQCVFGVGDAVSQGIKQILHCLVLLHVEIVNIKVRVCESPEKGDTC